MSLFRLNILEPPLSVLEERERKEDTSNRMV
jgi:hypothetical protein